MDNTTEYDVLDIDQSIEQEDTELDTEHIETEDSENDIDEVAKLRSENKKLIEIIKRRKEKEAQGSQSQTIIKKQTNNTDTNDSTFKEELKLIAQGYTEEAVEYLKLVSKGAGVSLKEAEENPLFQAFQEKQEAERKAKKAQLGASRGASIKKSVDMSKMSPEDHQRIWMETVAKISQ